jgi:hypothetical protein
MSEPEARSQATGSYVLAVFACALWLIAYIAVCAVLLYHFALPVHDWVERQDGVLHYVCAVTVGLGYLLMLGIGGGVTEEIWKSVRRPAPSAEALAAADQSGGDEGRCPKCGFRDEWDGKTCGHCGYSHSPWKKGTTLNESD